MRNYVLRFRFEIKEEGEKFLDMLKKKYPDYQTEVRNDLPYFAFASKALPGVEGDVNAMLDRISVRDTDYVGLYYMREEDADKIKRNMILGHSDLEDQDLRAISKAEHENLLNDLFELDFVRLRFR